MKTRTPPIDRLLAKVEKTETCWIWRGAVKDTGYGVFNIEGRAYRVHRFAYEYLVGPIPDGLEIRHLCHNRICVNPDHLTVGTRKDNMHDMVKAGRYVLGRRWSGENNPRAKLSAADVLAIRADKRPLREIASQYGICIAHACSVRKGRLRQHG